MTDTVTDDMERTENAMSRTGYGCENCDSERFPKVSDDNPPDVLRLSCDECATTTRHHLIVKIESVKEIPEGAK